MADALDGGAVDEVADPAVAVAAEDEQVGGVLLDEGGELDGRLAVAEVEDGLDAELAELGAVQLEPLAVGPGLDVLRLGAEARGRSSTRPRGAGGSRRPGRRRGRW